MAMASNTKLKALNKSWKEAAKREPAGFSDLEPAVYLMGIQGELGEFGPQKKLAIRWSYIVQEGEAAGAVQSDFDNMETEENLFWIQSKLAKLGYELPEDITDLPEILEEISNEIPVARCKVVEKDGFTHVYVNKVVEESGGQTREDILGEEKPSEKPKGKGKKKTEAEPEPETKSRGRKKKAAETVEFEVGDKVKFTEEGEKFTGTISEINDDTADVEVDDTDEVWDVELSDLSKVEEEPAEEKSKGKRKKKAAAKKEPEIEVGSTVSFEDGDDEVEGEVTAITDGVADVEVDDEVYEVALEELTLVD